MALEIIAIADICTHCASKQKLAAHEALLDGLDKQNAMRLGG